MGFSSFVKSCIRLLKLSRKPGRSELWLSIKICMLGVLLIGLIGFIIRIISITLSAFGG